MSGEVIDSSVWVELEPRKLSSAWAQVLQRTSRLLLSTMPAKLGINGFGRIGRLVFRAAMANPEVEVPGWIVRESDVLAEAVNDCWALNPEQLNFVHYFAVGMVHRRARFNFRCRGVRDQRPVHGPGLHGLPAQVRQRPQGFLTQKIVIHRKKIINSR